MGAFKVGDRVQVIGGSKFLYHEGTVAQTVYGRDRPVFVHLHSGEKLWAEDVDLERMHKPDDPFEVDQDWELGQPNGIGNIEPNDNREWFDPKHSTHRRRVITMYGPWEPIPMKEA